MLTRLMIFGLALVYLSNTYAAQLRNVRMHEAPSSVRLVFDTSEKIDYKIFYLENPNRIVIDLKNTRPQPGLNIGSLLSSTERFTGLRSATRGKAFRFVVETPRKTPFKVFSLKPVMPYGHRLVIDLETVKRKVVVATQEKIEGFRDIVVVLDPGHGGEDPGAIGPRNIQEKHVVLQIARRVKKKLDAKRGFSAVVLRDGDYYVPLIKRTEFAKKIVRIVLFLFTLMHLKVRKCLVHLFTCCLKRGPQVSPRNGWKILRKSLT